MQKHINSSDVYNRSIVLKEMVDEPYPTRECRVYYDAAKRTKNIFDMRKFFNECASNNINANEYIFSCIDLLKESETTELLQIFGQKILPKVDDYTLNDIISNDSISENIREMAKDRATINKVCDRILSNHEAITERFDIYSFGQNNEKRFSNEFIIEKCCDTINSFDMPIYAKYNCSLEECSYILQKLGRKYNDNDLTNTIYEYYALSCNPSSNEITKMKNVDKNNYCVEADINVGDIKVFKSAIQKACYDYVHGSDHSIFALTAVKVSVLKADGYDIKKNFHCFLELLYKSAVFAEDENILRFIIDDILANLYDDLYDVFVENPEGREICNAISIATKNIINECDVAIATDDIRSARIIMLRQAFDNFDVKLVEALEFLYPEYALECVNMYAKNPKIMAYNEFKIFKFDNLITRTIKADRFLIKQFDKFKQSFKGKVYNLKSKIFESAEGLDNELRSSSNVDFCVSKFDYIGDRSELLEFATSCIKNINNNILNDSDFISYFLMKEDAVEFYIKDPNTELSIDITESTSCITNDFDYVDASRINQILEYTENLNPNFDFINDSVRFFSNNEYSDLFEVYIDACSISGIEPQAIKEMYGYIVNNVNHPAQFVAKNSYLIDQYTLFESEDPLDSLRALHIMQAIVEGKVDESKKSDDDKKKTEDKKSKDNKKSDDDKKKLSDKIKEAPGKIKQGIKDAPDKIKQKIENAPEEIKLNLNNLKLYLHGVKQHIKNADAKTKTFLMNMDSAFDRLVRSLKQAAVSDRREAIIKGSVIPSFHKCLVLAASGAAVWAFVPGGPPIVIISAIAGFATSKHLTKKERALMFDDIQVEIQLMEKEIQMADQKDQVKKMRQLMRMKKELERTAARIKYNEKIGRDFIPGGHYIHRDQDR